MLEEALEWNGDGYRREIRMEWRQLVLGRTLKQLREEDMTGRKGKTEGKNSNRHWTVG